MRKVFLFDMISLDGFFEGPDRDINWHLVDDEFNEFAIEQLAEVDLLLFGRITYELMAGYWPTEQAVVDDTVVAGMMNATSKIVFSTTMDKADWQNTRLVKKDAAIEVAKVKKEPGKDIAIFGSSDLAVTLLQEGLIDELRIIVNPVLLGNGKTLFSGLAEKVDLNLLKTRVFRSGNVLLYYQPVVQI